MISADLETDGLDLFIERYGHLVSISQAGQTVMRERMTAALHRIDRGPQGLPIKLYPFTRSTIDDAPALIVIDPTLAAGRPVLKGTGLATGILAERYKAGESVAQLARDYERSKAEIEEAIRCELRTAALIGTATLANLGYHATTRISTRSDDPGSIRRPIHT